MLQKLSLFKLNQTTLKTKLSKVGINNTTLKNDIEIYFSINRLDSRDYYIEVNKTKNRINYFNDFILSSIDGIAITIEDIIYYVQNELKERYLMGNKKYEEQEKVTAQLKQLQINFKSLETKNKKLENEAKEDIWIKETLLLKYTKIKKDNKKMNLIIKDYNKKKELIKSDLDQLHTKFIDLDKQIVCLV